MNPHDSRTVLVFDSDPAAVRLVQEALGRDYVVQAAGRDADSLRDDAPAPCLVVAAAGADGYALCQRIKGREDGADIPVVILATARDEDAHLLSYDVGAEDCILRDGGPQLLATRLARTLRERDMRSELRAQVQYANQAVMTALTSLGETGMVIDGVKRFNRCDDGATLARCVLDAAAQFELRGAVELHIGASTVVLNQDGPATPLECSILQQLATMDRITQFRNRLFIRYPHVRIVVNNLPLEDSDRCGRLRDHLAMLIEAADIRAGGIEHASQSNTRGEAIQTTIQTLSDALSGIDVLQRQGRMAATTIRAEVMLKVEHALASLGLSENQEVALLRIVQEGLETLADIQLAEAHLQDELSAAIADLQRAVAVRSVAA